MRFIFLLVILISHVIDPFSIRNANAFAEKMGNYFNKSVSYTMRDLPADWWGATLAEGDPYVCTNTVYLDTRWEGSTSPLWKYALVHEWVHTTQGKNCVNNEHATDLKAFAKLAEAKEWKAFIVAVNYRLALNQLTMEEVVDTLR